MPTRLTPHQKAWFHSLFHVSNGYKRNVTNRSIDVFSIPAYCVTRSIWHLNIITLINDN